MNLKKQSFLLILLGFLTQSYGQIGIFPNETNWKHLKTKTFDIITPDEQINISHQVLKDLMHFQEEDSLLGHYRDKRTYIIYGDHAISNGFVGPGPYRSGLYLTPPQNNFIGPGSWIKNLVNHENHHFVQHADARQGALRPAFNYLGDFADSFLSNVYLLGWYWEGDAVYRESYSDFTGRGNYSHFLNRNRLFAKMNLKVKNKRFTHAYNRPYNLNIPSHYNLGYEMVNYLAQLPTDPLYGSVDHTVGQLRRLPNQIKKNTNQSLFQHYEIALDSIVTLDSKMAYIKPGFVQMPSTKFKHQTSLTGLTTDQDDFYCIEYSFKDAPRIIHNEKTLSVIGQAPDGVHRLQSNGHYLTWNELRNDPNFSTRSYSEIMVWDKGTSKKKQVTHKTKSFSPSLNPRAHHQLAFLSLKSDYTFAITLMDLKTGNSEIVLDTEARYLRNLNFSENGKYLTFINQEESVQKIGVYHIEDQTLTYYEIPQLKQISNVVYSQTNTFILTADKDKYEYIYLYSPEKQVLKRSVQVTSALKHLQIKGSLLTFDYQTIYGLRNGLLNLNTVEFVSDTIKENTRENNLNTKDQPLDVTTVDYSDGRPRLKFHSVIPYLTTQDIQLEVYGNDFLRKNQFLYRYYQNFGSENSVHQALYTYAHFPVHISGTFTHSSSGTRNVHMNNSFISSFKENKFGLQLSYPTSVVKSGYSIQNTPSVEMAYRNLKHDTVRVYYGSDHVNVDAKNTFRFAKNRGPVALSSPFYVQLTNRFATDFKDAFLFENSFKTGINLFRNSHFLEAELGFISENTDQNMYRYRHQVVTPSTGYFLTTSSLGRSSDAFQVFLSDASLHYKIKLINTVAYPNMRFTDFIYLKRISIEPFVEHSHYHFRDGGDQYLRSYGSHVNFDIQWVKSLPVRLQLTFARTPDLKSNSNFIGFGLVF